jgi:hypothetical protein
VLRLLRREARREARGRVRVGLEHARPGRAQAAREEAAQDRGAAGDAASRGQRWVVWREVDDVRGLRARIARRRRRDGGDDEREEDGETRVASPRHGAGRKQIGPAAAAADGAEDNCN